MPVHVKTVFFSTSWTGSFASTCSPMSPGRVKGIQTGDSAAAIHSPGGQLAILSLF